MNHPLAEKLHSILGLLSLSVPVLAEFKAGMSLEQIKAEYSKKIESSLLDYADSNRSIVAFRNQFRRAVNDAFTLTTTAGWVDGGADGPIPQGLRDWLITRIETELKFVDEVFVKLKKLRTEGDKEKLAAFARARAEGYASSLDGVYNQGVAWANRKAWGTWRYGDTDHCETCQWLNGQRHKLSWFISKEWIPQSKNLACTGRYCRCGIYNDDGERIL